MHVYFIRCGYNSRAAIINASLHVVRHLFEGGYYSKCGVYSRKYSIDITTAGIVHVQLHPVLTPPQLGQDMQQTAASLVREADAEVGVASGEPTPTSSKKLSKKLSKRLKLKKSAKKQRQSTHL